MDENITEETKKKYAVQSYFLSGSLICISTMVRRLVKNLVFGSVRLGLVKAGLR